MNVYQNLSTEQFEDIINTTNIVSKANIHGVITYVNSKFIEISGYSEEELLHQNHNIVRDPQSPKETFHQLWSTIQSKKVWNGIITNLAKDGSKYTVNAFVFPILNEKNEIIEYISVRHDITEALALHEYQKEQEHIAKEKLESGIINDMTLQECQVLYYPSDILSGDFYSIYKLDNGSIFLYLMDGQGHGISPALTVFAISSMMNHIIRSVSDINTLVEEIAPNVQKFLGELEQLSYTMIMIHPDKKNISYASAGMYPFLIKKGNEITKVKANNTPFMNFSTTPKVTHINLGNWDSLLLYSDGLKEHENTEVLSYTPEKLILEASLIPQAIKKICSHTFDDDVTLIHLRNII